MVSDASSLRLVLDGAALASNWRWLRDRSEGAACGAAVKADGYGLGAQAVVERLLDAGCRDFFVATWGEASALADRIGPAGLSILHGVREDDLPTALTLSGASDGRIRPVLNSRGDVARWRAASGGACDVMIDTGINRLGLAPSEVGAAAAGLTVETVMSHLACADEADHPMNAQQAARFMAAAAAVPARRRSLANSAAIVAGGHGFDLTRPGLALYGGVPGDRPAPGIRPVVALEAAVLQVRDVPAGDTVGYGATWTAPAAGARIAILNLGYADGYPRSLSDRGMALAANGRRLPVAGRVSMDLLAVDASGAEVAEGDWLRIAFDLAETAAAAGQSQYELLTGLGHRYQRHWI